MELLAPAGNWEMLNTAIQAGADSVYIGIEGLNMRARARNFTIDNLTEAVEKCHQKGVKLYLCVNTIVFEDELEDVDKILQKAKQAQVDAIICWDLAVVKMAKNLGLEVHLSTQASSANSMSIEQYKQLGVSRVVLARECSLEDIEKIKLNADIEIETFVHGAMCVAVSGRCFMSQFLYNKSANRGECIQPCRRSYIVKDSEEDKELQLQNHHVMSPRDMCTICIIDKLIDAGIDAFKIEGRNRSAEYVKTTVECYKKAIDLHKQCKLTDEIKQQLYDKLSKVYHRGFSDGFYMGKPIGEWSESYGSQSLMVKQFIGTVKNYFPKPKAAQIKVETGSIDKGDKLLIIGPTTGCQEIGVASMRKDDRVIDSANKGDSIGLKLSFKARKNDKVYKWQLRKE